MIAPCFELDKVRISIMYACEKQLRRAVVSFFDSKATNHHVVILQDADAVRTRRNTQDKTPSQEVEPSGMCRQDSTTSEKRISTATGISLSKQLSEKENTAF